MTVYQLPTEQAAFARWLAELAHRIPPGGGWYEVFAERDPDGLRACFDGTEILPWDVVESLLQDAGEPADGPLAVRGRTLYAAATGAHDRRPGAAAELTERRDLMERERRHAESRARELGDRLRATPAPPPEETARLEHELAWTRDDHARATARLGELTTRLERLGEWEPTGPTARGPAPSRALKPARTRSAGTAWAPAPASPRTPTPAPSRALAPLRALAPTRAPAPSRAPAAWAAPTQAATPPPAPAPVVPVAWTPAPAPAPASAPAPPVASPPPAPTPTPAASPAKAKRRPRGARYAWLEEEAEEQGPVAAPVPESLPPAGGAAPRGARFGGAASDLQGDAARIPVEQPPEAVRAAVNAVYALQRLRAQGRGGEAHALLCEAVDGPPALLPALAGELHRAGLDADWSILLWEAASLPPGRLAAVAGALADAGRAADCEELLRQGVARPVEELAGACDALRAEGHHREAHALLTAFVRVRAPEDAARLAGEDPRGLVPLLLEAARTVSESRERDLLHALRVAGLTGA
ncbi:UL36 very large tegument protein [Streptomyces sp. NPDC057101]|uniref:UL36 very large tegument protein n=1 Tax=Streptomyces sp. NPDC057101 TaxID=3346020 RepID=UPI0036365172